MGIVYIKDILASIEEAGIEVPELNFEEEDYEQRGYSDTYTSVRICNIRIYLHAFNCVDSTVKN